MGERTDILEDLAVLTGATVLGAETGRLLKDFDLDWVGAASRAVVTAKDATLVGPCGLPEEIEQRQVQLQTKLNRVKGGLKRQLSKRLGRISGGVARFRLGARSEAEMQERKARVEDALLAMKSATEEGVVPGAGAALVRVAAKVMDAAIKEKDHDKKAGLTVVANALEAPFLKLAANAGLEGKPFSVSIATSKKKGTTLDPFKGELVDAEKSGILDSAKVARCAVRNAASVAALLLTTSALVKIARH